MFSSRGRKTPAGKGNRVLIHVNVLGSAGALRLVIKEDELVSSVIDMALKSYAREARLPVLGSDVNDFMLFCPAAGPDAVMAPSESIKSYGSRNFILWKKPHAEEEDPEASEAERRGNESPRSSSLGRKANSGKWKAWINRSLTLKIASFN